MRRKAAFTLVEMLAVIAIMLVLMTATFGMFSMFAEQTGPESVLSIVQAVMNGARDYAASNGVSVRVLFETTNEGSNDVIDGTRMIVQRWSAIDDRWEIIPGRRPVELHGGMYILNGIPTGISGGGSLPTTSRTNPSADDIKAWRDYEKGVRAKVHTHAFSSGGGLKGTKHNGFCIEFGPSGYPPVPGHGHTPLDRVGEMGLTVIRAVIGEGGPGKSTVASYAFYPINASTGTRLVFE